jgi:hypothetical protein
MPKPSILALMESYQKSVSDNTAVLPENHAITTQER